MFSAWIKEGVEVTDRHLPWPATPCRTCEQNSPPFYKWWNQKALKFFKISNSRLLANNYAKAHNRSNKQAIVTILSLCFIYIFVWLPTFIEETYSLLTPRHHVHTTPLPLWFNKLHIYIYFAGQYFSNSWNKLSYIKWKYKSFPTSATLYFTGTLANPILYTLINSKFRNASKRRIYNAMVMKMSYQSSSTPSVQTVKKRVVISNSLPVERLRAEGNDNAFHSEWFVAFRNQNVYESLIKLTS